MNFSGNNAGVQQDAVAPHSATAAHMTAPALSSGACVRPAAAFVSQAAARVNPLDTRRASLALSQPRVAVPESETAEHENQDGRRSEMYFSGHNARVQQNAVTPLHYSGPDRSRFGPARCSCQPPVCPACCAYSLSASCCSDRERKFRL